MIGGKYTTFRKMTQELASEIVPRLNLRYKPNLTLNPLRQHSVVPTFSEHESLNLEMLKKIISTERVKTFDDLISRRLSLIEKSDTLTHVMGIPVDQVKNLLKR